MSRRGLLAVVAAFLGLVAASCGGGAPPTIKIGVLADCEGTFGFTVAPSYGGAELPLIGRGARRLGQEPKNGVSAAEVAGKKIQLVFGWR